MRLPIAYEGRPTNDGRTVKEFEWEEGPIPLTAPVAGRGSYILGKVTDLRREEDGTITADVEVPLIGHAPQVECDSIQDVVSNLDNTEVTFGRARIRAVFLGMTPAWPEWPDLMITHETREYV